MPPEKVHIYDDQRGDKTLVLGPYNEGSDVSLLCEVRGGKQQNPTQVRIIIVAKRDS